MRIVKYMVYGRLGRTAVFVEMRREEPEAWAVTTSFGEVLNRDSEWELEPQPSSRTAEFLARTRGPTALEAVRAFGSAGPPP